MFSTVKVVTPSNNPEYDRTRFKYPIKIKGKPFPSTYVASKQGRLNRFLPTREQQLHYKRGLVYDLIPIQHPRPPF